MRGATSRAATCLVTCRRSNGYRSFSPLRTIRAMSDDVLRRLSPRFDAIRRPNGVLLCGRAVSTNPTV